MGIHLKLERRNFRFPFRGFFCFNRFKQAPDTIQHSLKLKKQGTDLVLRDVYKRQGQQRPIQTHGSVKGPDEAAACLNNRNDIQITSKEGENTP